MAVHSTQLGHGIGLTAGAHNVYTVPTGKRTILKSLSLRNATAGAVTGGFAIALAGGGTLNFFQPLAATPAAGSTVHLALWIVLNAGDVLQVDGIAGSGIDAIASGAELTV